MPAAAAGNANYLWYSTPNKAAVSLLNEELLGDPNIVVPAEVLKNCDYHRVLSQARQKEINMGMRRVLNLVRETKQKIADAAGDDDS